MAADESAAAANNNFFRTHKSKGARTTGTLQ
jgi:hypothetical protein